MKRLAVLAGCALLALGTEAGAGCTAVPDQVVRIAGNVGCSQNPLLVLLSGKTACGTGQGPNAGDRWQEYHQADGTLIEYAKGPTDAVDPTHTVGTWAVTGTSCGRAAYNYSGGNGYEFSVYNNVTTSDYSFCDFSKTPAVEVARVTFISGQAACPSP